MAVLEISQRVDARGLSCPMPIVKTAQAVKTVESGNLIEVLATDPGPSRTSRPGRARPATSSSSSHRTAASTASSSDESEAPAMTTTMLEQPSAGADRSDRRRDRRHR